MRAVEQRIEPEPTDAERRAILAALAEGARGTPAAYESEWRRSGIDSGAPSPWPAARIRRGATRA